MFEILLAMGLFVVSVIIHLVWCRCFPSKDLHVLAYFLISMLLAMGGVFAYFWLGGETRLDTAGWLPMTASLLYILLLPTYAVFYFSTKVESPSKRIIVFLRDKGPSSFLQLNAMMKDEEIIQPRIHDLVATGFIAADAQGYRLLPKGKSMARVLRVYEQLCGQPRGG